MTFQDLGITEYKKAWNLQERVFDNILNEKANSVKNAENTLFFCEHPHVYTLGKSGEKNNLLIDSKFLQKINASYFKTNRGGDITYHGPGQIVGYPILDLEYFNLGIKQYIYQLEEVIISTLSDYRVKASRLDGAAGVWLDTANKGKARKICAVGVRVSKLVTMHGFAFNVNTNLNYFNYINPCGFVDKGVTSLEKEVGEKIDIKEVKHKLLLNFSRIFHVKFN
ncbi:MAG: lipoyl(octanoyl) transferase LipB [Chlorobi bacterium]|nr:lipoyl(octanoyl) transferase LipB [Chlorobiota bacterium]